MENTTESATEQETKDVKGNEEKEAENTEAEKVDATSEEGPEDKTPTDEYKEKYYYLAAEMQNMQRRFDKEKEGLLKYGNEKLITDMLDVVDNLGRTLSFIKNDQDEKVKNIVVGIEMIEKLFLESLAKHGLKKIEALGEEFDPHYHEALSQRQAEDKKNMEILEVQQNGYTLNDRVIRAAKVIVAKND